MMDFTSMMARALAMLGLILAPKIVKILGCLFRQAAQGQMLPCALLRGLPGAGKTSTAEAFAVATGAAKFFYQCNPGTGMDQLIGQPNLAAVLRRDASTCISDGILIQAVRAAMAGQDVVLILDEIDKASPDVDSYLLDFLQSRRIHDSTMEELVVPSDVKFWVFLTSNNERDLSDALMRRVRRIDVERPSRSTVAEVLGIEETAALLDIWDACDKLAISQMRSYLQDGGDPEEIDADILSQYIDDLPATGEAEAETTISPGKVWLNPDSFSNILGLEDFTWEYQGTEQVIVTVRTITELFRLRKIIRNPDNICICESRNNSSGLEVDCMDPILQGPTGAIYRVGDETFLARAEGGRYYIMLDGSTGDLEYSKLWQAVCSVEHDVERKKHKAKQAKVLQEVRKESSTGQAQHLLERLGLDDLL